MACALLVVVEKYIDDRRTGEEIVGRFQVSVEEARSLAPLEQIKAAVQQAMQPTDEQTLERGVDLAARCSRLGQENLKLRQRIAQQTRVIGEMTEELQQLRKPVPK